MLNKYYPIALFSYNRPELTNKVFENLSKNPEAIETEIFYFVDGASNIKDVDNVKKNIAFAEKYIHSFKAINLYHNDVNYGLKNSIINGINKVFQNNEAVIVLEDDIVVSSVFLSYMNRNLRKFKNDTKVFSIAAFNYPNFSQENFLFHGKIFNSWGWAIWKDRWNKIDFYEDIELTREHKREIKKINPQLIDFVRLAKQGKIDSWATYAAIHQIRMNLSTIYPSKSLVKNEGFENGTHFSGKSDFSKRLQSTSLFDGDIKELKIAKKYTTQFSKCKKRNGLDKKLRKKLINILIGFSIGLTVGLISSN